VVGGGPHPQGGGRTNRPEGRGGGYAEGVIPRGVWIKPRDRFPFSPPGPTVPIGPDSMHPGRGPGFIARSAGVRTIGTRTAPRARAVIIVVRCAPCRRGSDFPSHPPSGCVRFRHGISVGPVLLDRRWGRSWGWGFLRAQTLHSETPRIRMDSKSKKRRHNL